MENADVAHGGLRLRIIANALTDTGLVPICRPVFTNPVQLGVKPANWTLTDQRSVPKETEDPSNGSGC
jgi:hypothetical protein